MALALKEASAPRAIGKVTPSLACVNLGLPCKAGYVANAIFIVGDKRELGNICLSEQRETLASIASNPTDRRRNNLVHTHNQCHNRAW